MSEETRSNASDWLFYSLVEHGRVLNEAVFDILVEQREFFLTLPCLLVPVRPPEGMGQISFLIETQQAQQTGQYVTPCFLYLFHLTRQLVHHFLRHL